MVAVTKAHQRAYAVAIRAIGFPQGMRARRVLLMPNRPGGAMSLIALEEHYAWDPASSGNVVATWLRSNNHVAYQRLYDRGPLRLEQMDAAGIDFQILSLFDPGVQDDDDTARAVDHARRANDDLAETVRATPERFGGFATLATQDPDAAAAELERAVRD